MTDDKSNDVERLLATIEQLTYNMNEMRVFYHQFHNDALNYMLKKDVLNGFIKYRKKLKRERNQIDD